MATFHAIAVRRDDSGRIASLLVTAEWPIVPEHAREMRRADVSYFMGLHPASTFYTAYKEGTEWKRGDEICQFPFRGRYYLSSASNVDHEDSIGALPPF